MKHLIKSAFLLALLGIMPGHAQEKEHREVIRENISLRQQAKESTLLVKNVFGSIAIEAYNGTGIQMEVAKTIRAKNEQDLELGKRELTVKVSQAGNHIVLRPDAPYIDFDENRLSFKWCQDNESVPYQHQLDFTIRVPADILLNVSTINDGTIEISNTRGSHLKADNINGGITLNNISGQTEVHAINGAVTISYATNPVKSSTYYSLNGDITISYQEELSADIGFTTMNGELYTDFEIARQYAKTIKNATGKGSSTQYSYVARPVVQIGKGGTAYDFETLNGNVIIKKI
jgi:hypothetical protein